jgi:preprotein translocase subunit SecA
MYKRPQRLPASILERPQKQLQRQNLMVRWWRSLTSILVRPFRASTWFYRLLLIRIKWQARSLKAMSEQHLDYEIITLRTRLRKKGLTNALIVRSFAVIREVAGRELGMWHFDVQLLGGLAILHCNVAQMQTGEGKTLTATLPIACAALAAIPTHLVTVNDYLTARDAELMRPVYQRLGLSVGVIIQGLTVAERKEQYACDIVYCTNNELAFDYLKDSIILGNKNKSLHLHASRLQPSFRSQDRAGLNNLMLRGLHFAVVDEVDGVLLDEARTPLIISGEEVPQKAQQQVYEQAMSLILLLNEDEHYKKLVQQRQIEMTSTGERKIEELARDLGPLWSGKVRRLELVRQALTAWHLFERDKDYLIDDDKVVIIDEHTGRMMPDRTWEKGLHQLIELKEQCSLTAPRATLASISFQNFFRHFHHLAGMTGTAEECTKEFWRVYALPVVTIPTNKNSRRKLVSQRVYSSDIEKWQAVIASVKVLQKQNRPVLVGTQSLAASEHLSRFLEQEGIKHQVLNARQDKIEAEIVAAAGKAGKVTIATSMAGRGTDIKLTDNVESYGGLHVIITGLHESSRIDRQLRGRCGRQGDRGSYELILSLEDKVIIKFWLTILKPLISSPMPHGLKNSLALHIIRHCQHSLEKQHERSRKDLMLNDEQQRDLLSFTHQRT